MYKIGRRPWGYYEIILDEPNYKIKRLVIDTNGELSLQSHKHRKENWIVVQGVAGITLEDKHIILNRRGQSVTIPPETKHRVKNKCEIPLIIIEIQTGHYLGEDDIIRYKDELPSPKGRGSSE